jgi:Fe(3+) dicitrate transport protein
MVFGAMFQKGMNYLILPKTMMSLNVGLNIDKVSSNISVKHTSKMRTTAGSGKISGTNATDAQVLVDLGVRYALQDNMSLSIGVKNLMDDDGITARRPYGARPTMPRSLSLGVDYTF